METMHSTTKCTFADSVQNIRETVAPGINVRPMSPRVSPLVNHPHSSDFRAFHGMNVCNRVTLYPNIWQPL